jgi:MOSC domain-containing protein YiiM
VLTRLSADEIRLKQDGIENASVKIALSSRSKRQFWLFRGRIDLQAFSGMNTITIRHLFISPGHNFFGHHGQPAGKSPLREVSEIECIAGCGVRGDRFFDFKQDYKGQITFFSNEVFEDVCHLLGANPGSAGVTRRNVITEGIDLSSLIGKRFTVQDVEFEGVCECMPCYWMDYAIAPGAQVALQGRGGLRAKILKDGIVCAGF